MQCNVAEIKHKDGEAQPLITQLFVHFEQSTHYIKLQNTVQALNILSLTLLHTF